MTEERDKRVTNLGGPLAFIPTEVEGAVKMRQLFFSKRIIDKYIARIFHKLLRGTFWR
jgi:hypothetical protein